jgi:hypothetical protein
MTLKDWADSGWVRVHQPSLQEVQNLLSVADRDMADAASRDISADWRFGIAYNAAIKLCTILVHASGYRVERAPHHYLTIAALSLILGARKTEAAVYLDACRIKRNTVEYDMAGAASELDADELLEFSRELRMDVSNWLRKNHRELTSGE